MSFIRKSRREWFGGIVYSESPGFTAFVDSARADSLGIPPAEGLSEGLLSAPLDVHLSLTNRCNLSCRGCYARNPTQADKDMPLDLAHGIIDRLAAMNVFTVALGGGEPFLHPRLLDIAHYARDHGVVPNVTTNGLVIDASTAKDCRVFGAMHVSCHDPSEMPRLTETIRILKNAGVDCTLNLLVSAATYARLPDIWKWCAELRVFCILLLKFKLTRNNRDCREMAISPSQEQSLFPLVRKLSRRHRILPLLDCSFFPALAFHRPKARDIEFFDVNGCVGGNAILAITTDGKFKPCSFCETSHGDALSLDRDTWRHNERLVSFRQMRTVATCHDCRYEHNCNGGCRVSETAWCR